MWYCDGCSDWVGVWFYFGWVYFGVVVMGVVGWL